MYMTPGTPSVGGFLPIHAVAQAAAFLSMHIGSGPGVVGLSGMQVQPFVPLRRVRIEPFGPIAVTVAFLATAAGAADIALRISAASDILECAGAAPAECPMVRRAAAAPV